MIFAICERIASGLMIAKDDLISYVNQVLRHQLDMCEADLAGKPLAMFPALANISVARQELRSRGQPDNAG